MIKSFKIIIILPIILVISLTLWLVYFFNKNISLKKSFNAPTETKTVDLNHKKGCFYLDINNIEIIDEGNLLGNFDKDGNIIYRSKETCYYVVEPNKPPYVFIAELPASKLSIYRDASMQELVQILGDFYGVAKYCGRFANDGYNRINGFMEVKFDAELDKNYPILGLMTNCFPNPNPEGIEYAEYVYKKFDPEKRMFEGKFLYP